MAELWSALVGAGAVIAGAALAGGFTLLKGRQESADKERDRLEQRVTRQREIRRDAYLTLINRAEAVDDLQRSLLSASSTREEVMLELDTASTRLRQSLLVVRMEGPAEVAQVAQGLVEKYSELSSRMLSGDLTLGVLLDTRIETLAIQADFLAATARALDSTG